MPAGTTFVLRPGNYLSACSFAGVAQIKERDTSKVGDVGENPAASAILDEDRHRRGHPFEAGWP